MHKYKTRRIAAFSLVELLMLVAIIAILAALVLPFLAGPKKGQGNAGRCRNNLKNVGLAFRIYATDNNDEFPQTTMLGKGIDPATIDALSLYRMLSNELSTPRILYCRSDTKREEAGQGVNFATMTTTNISYFVSLSATETQPATFLAGDRNLKTNAIPLSVRLLALTTNTTVRWTKEMHVDQGLIAMADGSVQQMSSSRLTNAVRDQDIATNYLVFP